MSIFHSFVAIFAEDTLHLLQNISKQVLYISLVCCYLYRRYTALVVKYIKTSFVYFTRLLLSLQDICTCREVLFISYRYEYLY